MSSKKQENDASLGTEVQSGPILEPAYSSPTSDVSVDRLLYSFWKWRAMSKRRNFLYPFMCTTLVALWLAARYLSTDSLYKTEVNGDGASSSNYVDLGPSSYSFYRALPNVMFALHASAFVLYLTRTGQRILNETQGKRLILLNVLSMNGLMVYVAISKYISTQAILTETEVGLIYGITSIFCMITTHHSGLSPSITSLNFILNTVLAIIFFALLAVEPWSSVSLVIVIFVVYVCIVCEDFELRLMYLKSKAKERRESPGDLVEIGGNISKDVAFVLELLDAAHKALHRELRWVGIVGSDVGDGTALETSLSPNVSVGAAAAAGAVHPHMALSRLLCRAVMMASMPRAAAISSSEGGRSGGGSGSGPETSSSVTAAEHRSASVNNLCDKIFGIMEDAAGTALPLYTGEFCDLALTSHVDIYEMLVFLLAQDAVCHGSTCICSVRLTFQESKWQVNLQIAAVIEGRAGGGLGPKKGNFFASSSFANPYSLHTSNPFHVGDDDLNDRGSGLLGGGGSDDNRWTTTEGIGKYLSTDAQLRNTYHTPLTRMANKIATTHANVLITVEQPEVTQGVIFHRRSIPVSGPTPFGARIPSGGLSDDARRDWVLVEQHAGDEAVLADLRRKLEMLKVPVKVFKGAIEYKVWNKHHNIVVVTQNALDAYFEQMHPDLARLSDSRVVLCSSASTYSFIDGDDALRLSLEQKYQLTDTHPMSILASLPEVHLCVQRVAHGQRPGRSRRDIAIPPVSSSKNPIP